MLNMVVQTSLEVSEVLKIIKDVHDFYNDAWVNLLWMVGILGGSLGLIVGVLVPWWIERAQRRSFVEGAESIKKEMRNEQAQELRIAREKIDQKVGEAMTELQEAIEKNRELLQKEMKEQNTFGKAQIYHVQGLVYMASRIWGSSAVSFAGAAIIYLNLGQDKHLHRVVEGVVGAIEFMDSKEYLKASAEGWIVDKLLKQLRDKNVDGMYDSQIEKLKKALDKAKERTASNTKEN